MTREQYDETRRRFCDLISSLVKSHNESVKVHDFDGATALMKEIKLNIAEFNSFKRDKVYEWLSEQDAPMHTAAEVVSYEVLKVRKDEASPGLIEMAFDERGIDMLKLRRYVDKKAAERYAAERRKR